MPKRAMAGCVITPVGQHTSWDRDKQVNKLPRWLSHLSGQHRSTFSPATTHLVVSTKQWRAQPQNNVIKRALELNAEGGNIHILTFDWLEDSLNAQTKKREGPYSWEKLDAGVRKLEEKATKAREKEAAKEAKSVPGILAEVFEESTSPFVNPVEKKKVEQKLAKDKELQESQQAEVSISIVKL